jgi:hypothetical protein
MLGNNSNLKLMNVVFLPRKLQCAQRTGPESAVDRKTLANQSHLLQNLSRVLIVFILQTGTRLCC